MNLWDIPAIDQHAHNLLNSEAWSSLPYAAVFTESRDADMIQRHVPHTLFIRRSLRDMAALLSCEPDAEAIDGRRRALGLEAGYLAATYPQVFVEFGLTIPFVSIAGMRSVLHPLLELTPVTKLLFSTDAHLTPELYCLGAKWSREVLADVLEDTINDGDLSASEADFTARRILHDNARELYPAVDGMR